VGTEVIVLDLHHRLPGFVCELPISQFPTICQRSVTYLTLDLGDIATGPSLVGPHRNNTLSIDTTLQECL
jgi:hypothetical protein